MPTGPGRAGPLGRGVFPLPVTRTLIQQVLPLGAPHPPPSDLQPCGSACTHRMKRLSTMAYGSPRTCAWEDHSRPISCSPSSSTPGSGAGSPGSWPDRAAGLRSISAVGLGLGAPGRSAPPPRRAGGCLSGGLQGRGPGMARDEEIELSRSRSGLSPHPHLKATHSQRPPFPCLSTGEKGPKGTERWDCHRHRQSQVWPQISARGPKACCTPVTPAARGVTLWQDHSSSRGANSPIGNGPQTLTGPRIRHPVAAPIGMCWDSVCRVPPGTPDEGAWLWSQTWEPDPNKQALTPTPSAALDLGFLFHPLTLCLLPPSVGPAHLGTRDHLPGGAPSFDRVPPSQAGL